MPRTPRFRIPAAIVSTVMMLCAAPAVAEETGGPATSNEEPTVLITGANRGLGLEFARQYAADGWNVIATARNPDRADELKALPVEVATLDVADQDSVDAMAAELAKSLSGKPRPVFTSWVGGVDMEPVLGRARARGAARPSPTRTRSPSPWRRSSCCT